MSRLCAHHGCQASLGPSRPLLTSTVNLTASEILTTSPVNLAASEILRKIAISRVTAPVSAEMLGDVRCLYAHYRRGQLPIWTRRHVPAAREAGRCGTSERGDSAPRQICETVPRLQSSTLFRVAPRSRTRVRSGQWQPVTSATTVHNALTDSIGGFVVALSLRFVPLH